MPAHPCTVLQFDQFPLPFSETPQKIMMDPCKKRTQYSRVVLQGTQFELLFHLMSLTHHLCLRALSILIQSPPDHRRRQHKVQSVIIHRFLMDRHYGRMHLNPHQYRGESNMIRRPQLSQKVRYNGAGGVCETQRQMVEGSMNRNNGIRA